MTEASFSLPFLTGRIRVHGGDTGGVFSMLEMRMAPGTGPPLHLHRAEHEFFYILEGGYTVEVAGRSREVGPAEVVAVPPGTPHRLTAGPGGGRHLTMFAPAGPEDWFPRAAELIGSGLAEDSELDGLYARYGMTRLPADAPGTTS